MSRGRIVRGMTRVGAALLSALALALVGAVAAQAATLSGTVTSQVPDGPLVRMQGTTVAIVDPVAGFPVAYARTDVRGTYSADVAAGSYDVQAYAFGWRDTWEHGVSIVRDRTLDLTLVPEGDVRLHGTLREDDGSAVSGASLWVGGPGGSASGSSDASGAFSLVVPSGDELSLSISAGSGGVDGWWLDASGLVLRADRQLDLTLPPHTQLTVHVRGEDGSPVAGAQVSASGLENTLALPGGGDARLTVNGREGITDAAGDGTIDVFDGSGPGLRGYVSAYPTRESLYASAFVPAPAVRGPTEIDVTVRRVAYLTLRLQDAGGVPLGARTTFDDNTVYSAWSGEVTMTSDEGRRRLTVAKQGGIGGVDWNFVSDLFGMFGQLEERLVQPAFETSYVQILDGDGDPVEGATVTAPDMVVPGGGDWLTGTWRTHDQLATTNGEGVAAFDTFAGATSDPDKLGEVVPPEGSGLPPARFAITDGSGGRTVVELSDDAHVAGQLAGADGPIARAEVTLGRESTTTDVDGSFALEVAPGTYDLTVQQDDWRLEGYVEVAGDRSLDLQLPARVQLTVRTLGSGGRAVEGADVTVPYMWVDGDFGDLMSGTLSTDFQYGTSDATGEARFATFAGSATPREGSVDPPAGSGYQWTQFALPDLTRSAAVEVPLVAPAPSVALRVVPDPLLRGDWWTVSRVAVQVTAGYSAAGTLACAVDGAPRTFAQTRTATAVTGTFYVNGEGRHSVGCTAVDRDGHLGSGQRQVNLDLHAPAAPNATADRPLDEPVYGWYRDSVTVSFSDNGDPLLADGSAGSGVDPASVPAPQTFSRSGTFTATGSVSDVAGKVSASRSLTVRVDADPPTTTISCPASPVALGARATASWHDADGQSGLVGPASGTVALDTGSIGGHSGSHNTLDRVGHRAAAGCRFTVQYAFVPRGGLVAAPAINPVAPGVASLPVWFSVGGDHGLGILGSGSPQVEPIACAGGNPVNRAFAATTSAPLAYDAGTGRYAIAWEVGTDVPAGTCAALRIQLDDGATHQLLFAR